VERVLVNFYYSNLLFYVERVLVNFWVLTNEQLNEQQQLKFSNYGCKTGCKTKAPLKKSAAAGV